jgi:tetratricopeptide (TPR) repeat protein
MRSTLALSLVLLSGTSARAEAPADALAQARAAEARDDAQAALPLYLEVLRSRPDDPVILQKVARQYSDLASSQPTLAAKKQYAEHALGYAERAVRLDPHSAVDELSLAICHGKLAAWSGTREKIEYSRLVEEEARHALALDPNYAWAHDVLGHWNAALASLSGTQRFFVCLFYGELPPASYAEAIAQLRQAVTLEPDEPCHRVELGFAYLGAGRRDEARAEFLRAAALPARASYQRDEQVRAREALAGLAGGTAIAGS